MNRGNLTYYLRDIMTDRWTDNNWDNYSDNVSNENLKKITQDVIERYPLQFEIGEFSRQKFWGRKSNSACVNQVITKLETEVSELIEQIDKSREWPASATNKDIAEEAADVLFMLSQLGTLLDFDLLGETWKKLEINKKRKWKLQADGTYQHVKEDNDDLTPRDELRDEILGYFEQINSHLDSHDSFTDAEMRSNVNEIIALVTDARDMEIYEALLSEETVQRVEATVSYMDGYRDHDIADGVIWTAIDAIGLDDGGEANDE